MGLFDFFKPKQQEPTAPATNTRADSFETALVINATNTMAGIRAEYEFIGSQSGEKNKDWKLVQQSLIEQNEKFYDTIEIELTNGQRRTFYFDITQFYGQ